MPRFVSVTAADDPARFAGPRLPVFDPSTIARHGADESFAVFDDDGVPIARASLWWSAVPAYEGQRLGIIGHFAASTAEGATLVLNEAGVRLRQHGCTLAVGPMDGNTWRRYRWISERGSEPPFLMEPDNPGEYPAYWEAAGFHSLASYFSALNSDLSFEDPQVARAGERLHRADVRARPLDAEHYEEELRRIYEVSVRSFGGNFLYTPLPEDAFVAQYLAVRDKVRPELVLLAELDGQPVGYVFNIPDWLRGPATDTVIIKTVAVVPGRQVAGLGTWLVARAQIVARELGYRRAIHALMHESNNSLNLSARYAKPFRRYTLYSRPL